MKAQSVELKANWVWKERDVGVSSVLDEVSELKLESGWTPVHAMPSDIHVELMKTQRIPDPYLRFNEHKVQCEEFTSDNVEWYRVTEES